MEWTLATEAAPTLVSWEAGHLDGDPALVELVLELAAQGGAVAPVVGANVLVGLAVPIEAWATITVALTERFGFGAVLAPDPPVPFAEVPADAVI